jgi:hypothetical protein
LTGAHSSRDSFEASDQLERLDGGIEAVVRSGRQHPGGQVGGTIGEDHQRPCVARCSKVRHALDLDGERSRLVPDAWRSKVQEHRVEVPRLDLSEQAIVAQHPARYAELGQAVAKVFAVARRIEEKNGHGKARWSVEGAVARRTSKGYFRFVSRAAACCLGLPI